MRAARILGARVSTVHEGLEEEAGVGPGEEKASYHVLDRLKTSLYSAGRFTDWTRPLNLDPPVAIVLLL